MAMGMCQCTASITCLWCSSSSITPRPGPDPADPFADIGELLVHRLHEAGGLVHGKEWPLVGVRMVRAQTGGRTGRSMELTHSEGLAIVESLKVARPDAFERKGKWKRGK